MKNNISNALYEAFDDREFPSEKVKESIHIELSKMEENKKGTTKIKIIALRKAAMVAAAVLLICIIAGNVGGVQASIHKLFAFIPGVGIVEEEKNEILYYMAGGSQTKDNGLFEVKLNSIIVTKEVVCVNWQITLKKKSEDKLEAVPSYNGVSVYTEYSDMKLVVGDKSYEKSWGDYGTGVDGSVGRMGFEVSDVNWNLTDEYQIIFQDMKFDFSLQKYEVYKKTEDIGATQILNDISITAIPEWEENGVIMTLYSLNCSNFDSVYGYQDLLSERVPYLTIEDTAIECEDRPENGEKEVYFDLSGIELTEEMKASAVLHIPTIEVKRKENKKIKISISNDISKSDYPESVQFSDSTMHIISVEESIKEEFGKCVKLTLKFDYDRENLALEYFSNLFINNNVGGLAWNYNEDNGYYYLYVAGDCAINEIKSITFDELVYVINEEYQIDLNK